MQYSPSLLCEVIVEEFKKYKFMKIYDRRIYFAFKLQILLPYKFTIDFVK